MIAKELMMKQNSASQAEIDFERITQAIRYLEKHFKQQPSLEEIAKQVGLSPSHFQRMFTAWAGTSPKQFGHYLTIEYAKKLLEEQQTSLIKTTIQTGLSSPSRLHDLFIHIEGMTPGDYKNGGENIAINYQFTNTIFGKVLIASTAKGVCYLAFVPTGEEQALERLFKKFPRANFQSKADPLQAAALSFFRQDWSQLPDIKLHLKGTPFQHKVWESLLKIPLGQLSTYGRIATDINLPKACRAVGTAVGDNPVAFLIPCHRIIQATGVFGNYHWGSERKLALIGWEAARVDNTYE
jgi:AraC family transcriptional regulator of adaptative response/methylated-DNA-[protein]-cysteine methyltransferase